MNTLQQYCAEHTSTLAHLKTLSDGFLLGTVFMFLMVLVDKYKSS